MELKDFHISGEMELSVRNLSRWVHMSIADLNQELEQLRKNAFLLGQENSFIWQFRISYLENYIEERIKQREEMIPR